MLHRGLVIPVCDRVLSVNVIQVRRWVVWVVRVVDDHESTKTLHAIVRVVPVCRNLSSRVEGIYELAARCDGALADESSTIRRGSVSLE